MELENEIKVIPVDENLPVEVAKLAAEGWQIVPGVKPIAIYHLVRQKKPEMSAIGNLVIDDSKIHIMRNGKIVG